MGSKAGPNGARQGVAGRGVFKTSVGRGGGAGQGEGGRSKAGRLGKTERGDLGRPRCGKVSQRRSEAR